MKIITTTPTKPPRIVIYGENKIGKSSFGASCPKPIFISTEDGLEHLGVEAFEECKSYEDVIKCLEFLVTEKHEYKTVVLDSLDWTEKLIWEKVCKDNNWAQIGDGPYGAGYKLALKYWRTLLKAFDILNVEKKMIVCLIGHAKITKFEDPERENYDKYHLDLQEKSGNLICEYSDIIGFASYKIATITKKEGFGQETTKVKSTGQRILNLNDKAAFKAGNRYGLPDQIELSWEALAKEVGKYFKKQKPGNLTEVVKAKEAKKGETIPNASIITVEEVEKMGINDTDREVL